MLTSDDKFAGWVLQTQIDETVNVTCLPTSHCDFSTDGPPIPVDGDDDIEFLPFLDFLGQPQLLVAPQEVGGKITAKCRQSDMVLDPGVRLLHTGAPILSLIAQVRPVLMTPGPSQPLLQCQPGVQNETVPGIFPGWQWRPVGGDTPADFLPWNTSIPQCGNYHSHIIALSIQESQ